MVKMKLPREKYEFWCLPGGGVEEGETPAEAAVRELKEECRVDGVIIRENSIEEHLNGVGVYRKYHTFLVDIGDQEPELGNDPDHDTQMMNEIRWLSLAEIPERDRAFLFSAGIMSIKEFHTEVLSWGNGISYPE
jgi:8-oxo-dGTP diphosphatase